MTMDDLEKAYQMRDPRFGGHQRATGVVAGPEGITVLASANVSGDSNHTWILRLSLDGAVIWQHHYDPKYGSPGAIARLSTGELVMAGGVQRSAMEFQASLLRTDATGTPVGAVSLGPRGDTGFGSVQSNSNGAIFAAGASGGKGWLVATDSKFTNPGELAIDVRYIELIRLLSSGDIAVLGATERPTLGFGQTKLVSVAADGNLRWERLLPTTGRGDPAGLIVRQNGVIAVGNGGAGEGAPTHIWLVHCDNAGTVTWERKVADAGAWAAVGLADGFAIAGTTTTPNGERVQHVWRFANDGTLRSDQSWSQRQLGSGLSEIRESIRDLDATSDGGLVLVGTTTRGQGKTNVWIIRLSAEGKMLWERTFGSPRPQAP